MFCERELIDSPAYARFWQDLGLGKSDRAEYKRQQAAPGLKISPKAFGYGRRLPIAAKSEA